MATRTDDIRQSLMKWLGQQGASTVLLMGIAAGIWFGGPVLLSELKQFITDQNAAHEKQMTRLADSFDADQERDARVIERLLQSHGVRSGDVPELHKFLDQPALSAKPK